MAASLRGPMRSSRAAPFAWRRSGLRSRGVVRQMSSAGGDTLDAAAEGSVGAARGVGSAGGDLVAGVEAGTNSNNVVVVVGSASRAAPWSLGISMEGVVLALVFLIGTIQTRMLHRNGMLRLESSTVTVWDSEEDFVDDSVAARLMAVDEVDVAASAERAEARRRKLIAARAEQARKKRERLREAAVSEEVLQQQMKIAESRELKRREEERSRAALREEERKRVFAEQIEAKKLLEAKRLERAERERELDELKQKEMDERRKREAKESMERQATLDKLNASGPLLTSASRPSTQVATNASIRSLAMDEECVCFEPHARLTMKRTGEREGNPAVVISISPTDKGVQVLDENALSEKGMLCSFSSREKMAEDLLLRTVASAAASTSASLVGGEHILSLMGEGPLQDGRIDDIDLRFVGRIAQVSAELEWIESASSIAWREFEPVLKTGSVVVEDLVCPAVVWPRGGPVNSHTGSDRLSELVRDAAEIIVRSADEVRAVKLLSQAFDTMVNCYGERIRSDGMPYAAGLLGALFVERVEALMDAKREHANARAASQTRAGRRGSASSILKLFEELEANVMRRTHNLALKLVLEGGTDEQLCTSAAGNRLISLIGPSHTFARMLKNHFGSDNEGDATGSPTESDLETVLESASERRTRMAKIKEESAPVPERVWACKNVAATLRASGALIEARRMMEKAIMLKQSVVRCEAEATDEGSPDLPSDPWFLEGTRPAVHVRLTPFCALM